MRGRKQLLWGILLAMMTSLIILGGALLSLAESGFDWGMVVSPTNISLEEEMPTLVFILPVVSSLIAQPSLPVSATPTPSLTPRVECPIPSGWMTVILPSEETTDSIAQRYGISVKELAAGNCWDYILIKLLAETSLYVPAIPSGVSPTAGAWCRPQGEQACVPFTLNSPTPTITLTRICRSRSDWVLYTVRSGDTLFSLSRVLGVSVYALQQANCMGNSTIIRTGQSLVVPFLPPPPVTATPRPTFTLPPPRTSTPTWPSNTPIPSITPSVPPRYTNTPTVGSTLPQHPPTSTAYPQYPTSPPPSYPTPINTLPGHPPTAFPYPTQPPPPPPPVPTPNPYPAAYGSVIGVASSLWILPV